MAIAFLSSLGCCIAFAEPPKQASSSIESEIAAVIRERLDAYAERDSVKWARFVADECLCANSTKAALQHEIASRPANARNWYGELQNLEVHEYGDIAVARYRVVEFTELSGHRVSASGWRNETLQRRDGNWKLVGLGHLPIPTDPAIATVDSRIYDAYVGRYEYAPGVVDTVTREGDRLMVQAPGQGKQELLPENETTFFATGEEWRLIFERGAPGSVSSVRLRLNGQDLVGRKLN